MSSEGKARGTLADRKIVQQVCSLYRTGAQSVCARTSFSRKRGDSFRFSDSERKRLKKVDDAKAEDKALADSDNAPLTEQQLDRMVLAREVQLTGLS
jgi:hypothetical protein